MNLVPLRAAAVAGTCAIALSFVSLPAQAAPLVAAPASGSAAAQMSSSGGDDHADEQGDDSTSEESGDSPSEQESDDASEQESDDSADETPATLPAEQGTPKQDFRSTVLLPKEVATRGIKVRYSGLTPKANYQPYWSGGEMGGELTKLKKANGKGVIVLTIRPGKDLVWMKQLGSEFTVGLIGQDTELNLSQQIQIKYDSDVALTTKRHGKKVLLAVTAERETTSGHQAPWKKVRVLLQKKTDAGWKTVRTLRTNSHGLATAKVKSGKTLWRAVAASTKHIAGATTKGHRR
ncbi:hypothetical protein [Amnibacterium endophyticum]|uniref:Uncharacterized protein n=1 Tax=Amnibacterium endophyticum TaxID=2109337 RepID=A0ABW4LAX3_9MICO